MRLYAILSSFVSLKRYREPASATSVVCLAFPQTRKTPSGVLNMDKDRIEGSANQVKGAIKQAAGKATGDSKLRAEGAADKAKGKLQNMVGGAKDALRDAIKH
jgi:uncharacterized protein YjbJ (UPF0337 family)